MPELFPRDEAGFCPEEGGVGEVRGQMSRVAAMLWATAGVVAWLSAVLPRPVDYQPIGVMAVGTLALFVAAGIVLAGRHITPLMHFFIVLAGVQLITVGAYFFGPQASSLAAMLYVWAGAYAFYFFDRWLAIFVVVAIGANYAAVIVLQLGNGFPLTRWLVVMATVVVTSVLVSHLVEQHALQLARQRKQQAREREQQARLAVAKERVRIARELHDVVAHHVSVMGIQAAAARQVFDQRRQDALAALASVETTSRQAITDLHQLVGLLRHDDETDDPKLVPQPGLKQLPALIDQVQESGLPVTLVIEGNPRPLTEAVELSAFRIVQEALTNTLKHAGPARAWVSIRYHNRRVELEVLDDGCSPPSIRLSGGEGLVGMRERVALHGGHLEAGARPGGGFRVHATLDGQAR